MNQPCSAAGPASPSAAARSRAAGLFSHSVVGHSSPPMWMCYRIVSRLALGPAAEAAPDREGHHPGIPPGDFAHGDTITSSTRGDIQTGG